MLWGRGAEGPRGRGPTYGAEGGGPRKANTLCGLLFIKVKLKRKHSFFT